MSAIAIHICSLPNNYETTIHFLRDNECNFRMLLMSLYQVVAGRFTDISCVFTYWSSIKNIITEDSILDQFNADFNAPINNPDVK